MSRNRRGHLSFSSPVRSIFWTESGIMAMYITKKLWHIYNTHTFSGVSLELVSKLTLRFFLEAKNLKLRFYFIVVFKSSSLCCIIVLCRKYAIDQVKYIRKNYIKNIENAIRTQLYLDIKVFRKRLQWIVWEPFVPWKISKHLRRTWKNEVALKQATILDELVACLGYNTGWTVSEPKTWCE